MRAAAALFLLLGTAARAQQPSVPATEPPDPDSAGAFEESEASEAAAITERILELDRQLQALLASLSAAQREATERLLAEQRRRSAAETPVTTVVAPPTLSADREGPAERTVEEPAVAAGSTSGSISGAPQRTKAPAAAPTLADPPSTATGAPRTSCNTLSAFDTNDDQLFSGGDRHWRHFYLWNDHNGDGLAEAAELTSLFDAGVRQVRLDLRRFDAVGDRSGDIEHGRYLQFTSPAARKKKFARSGRLLVDLASVRDAGGPQLSRADGASLPELVPFAAGLRLQREDGSVLVLNCP